jgi:hypothetical protein
MMFSQSSLVVVDEAIPERRRSATITPGPELIAPGRLSLAWTGVIRFGIG